MPGSKKIRIFAGPNGSGKSTLFKEFSERYNTGYFVNADELEKTLATSGEINLNDLGVTATQEQLNNFKQFPASKSLVAKAKKEGHEIDVSINDNRITDGASASHSYEGSFIASFIRYLMSIQNVSFSFETVMSDMSKVEEIKFLISQGYRAYFYFVCIDDPEVNIARVKNRVDKGGHPVSPERVADRYFRTLNLVHEVLPICYRAYLFDNSGKSLNMVAEQFNRELKIRTDNLPNWFMKYVYPHYIS